MSKKAAPPGDEPEVDEFHGMGGAYVVDPKTGRRSLEERTLSMDEAALAAQDEGARDGTA